MKTSKVTKKAWLLLPIFILICYAVASIGAFFTPGEWYASLNRAPWNPPNSAFPIVWSILYLLIGIAGWLIFTQGSGKLKSLWIFQLILNSAWSWIFFGQHWIAVGLVDLLLLDLIVAILILSCWRQKLNLPALLLSPYLIWICLATSLNLYILITN